MKEYRSALDRLKMVLDDRGDPRWIEEMGADGRPTIFYRYVGGRLKRFKRTVWGWSVSRAQFERFGEEIYSGQKY